MHAFLAWKQAHFYRRPDLGKQYRRQITKYEMLEKTWGRMGKEYSVPCRAAAVSFLYVQFSLPLVTAEGEELQASVRRFVAGASPGWISSVGRRPGRFHPTGVMKPLASSSAAAAA